MFLAFHHGKVWRNFSHHFERMWRNFSRTTIFRTKNFPYYIPPSPVANFCNNVLICRSEILQRHSSLSLRICEETPGTMVINAVKITVIWDCIRYFTI